MPDDPLQIGANALSNASRTSVSRATVLALLATGDGPGPLVRALFEDCAFESLDRMAAAAGMGRKELRAAHAVARDKHGARNPDFEGEELGF